MLLGEPSRLGELADSARSIAAADDALQVAQRGDGGGGIARSGLCSTCCPRGMAEARPAALEKWLAKRPRRRRACWQPVAAASGGEFGLLPWLREAHLPGSPRRWTPMHFRGAADLSGTAGRNRRSWRGSGASGDPAGNRPTRCHGGGIGRLLKPAEPGATARPLRAIRRRRASAAPRRTSARASPRWKPRAAPCRTGDLAEGRASCATASSRRPNGISIRRRLCAA